MLRRAASRSVSLLAAVALISFLSGAASERVASGGGAIDKSSLQEAKVICTGAITSEARALAVPPFWEKWRRAADLESCEVDFTVDGVVKGDDGLAGKTIHIWYPVEKPGRRRTGPSVRGFLDMVGAETRCLVCLVPIPDAAADTYMIVYLNACMFAGKKPATAGRENLTPDERLGREVAAAVLDPQPQVSKQGMRVAGAVGFSTPEMVCALRQRKSEPDHALAVQATGALIRLNDLETIYGLTDALSAWRDDQRAQGTVGAALWQVTDPKSALAIVPLVEHENAAVRKGAAYALRHLRCEKAVAALVGRLDDTEEMIRYDAIMGLAFQTDRMNPQWAWGFDHFRENPKELTDKWKNWWEQEGKGKYPSKAAVLEEFKAEKVRLEKEGSRRNEPMTKDVRGSMDHF